jgi:hypothetical protein
MGVNIDEEAGSKLLYSDGEDVKVDLLAQMSKEDRTKDREDEDEVESDGLSSDEEEEDEEVVGIFNSHIDPQTRYNYKLSIVRLVRFLSRSNLQNGSRKHRLLLESNFRSKLQVMEEAKASDQDIRQYIKDTIDKASKSFHPIKLQGPKSLTPEIFVSFLLSHSDTKAGEYKKAYGGHRSALSDLMNQCEVTPSQQQQNKLKRLFKGLNRTSAKARGATGARLGEGKDPLPFELYRAICKWLLEDESKESIFLHCFLTLTWNLMCRSRNTVYVHRQHLAWTGDAMTIKFAHTKKDMAGLDGGHKRHIYANPNMPEICAVLSTSRYLLQFPESMMGGLFPGSSQYDRFRKGLKSLLEKKEEEVLRMGVDPESIGVHSIRKGAATYVCSGITSGPNYAAICNRAGWTLGVRDRYMYYAEAGDQVVGRTVSGLNVLSHEISVSPPHILPEHSTDEVVDSCIGMLFPDLPRAWNLVGRYLLASLLYSREYLRKHTHPENPFSNSILFRRDIFDEVIKDTRVCYPYDNNNTVWRINFTGISQSGIDFCYHREQLELLSRLGKETVLGVKNLLDERNIGGGDLTLQLLKKEFLDPVMAKINNMNGQVALEEKKPNPSWGDFTFRQLPRNYRLKTNLSPLVAWQCWHLGEELGGDDGYTTPPWKLLKENDLRHHETMKKSTIKSTLYDLRKLCRAFDTAAGLTEKSNLVLEKLSELFMSDAVQQFLPNDTTEKGRERRKSQLTWQTCAKYLKNKQIKENKEKKLRNANSDSTVTSSKTSVVKSPPHTANTSTATITKKRLQQEVTPVIWSKISSTKVTKTATTKHCEEQAVKPFFLVTPVRKTSSKNAKESQPPHTPAKKVLPYTTKKVDSPRTHKNNRKLARKDIREQHQREIKTGAVKQHADYLASGEEEEDATVGKKALEGIYVPGPFPNDSADICSLTLKGDEITDLRTSGSLVTGSTVVGYLNLLVSPFYYSHYGVRRAHDTFMPCVSKQGWSHHVARMEELNDASYFIDWGEDKLIFIPIFLGAEQAGHWALLVVNRLRHPAGVLTYFDSLPNFDKGAYGRLKKLLARTPLTKKGSIWHKAKVPKQGRGTLDCSAWAMMMATAYMRDVQTCGEGQIMSADVHLTSCITETRFGIMSRNFIYKCLKERTILWDSLPPIGMGWK